MNDGIRSRKLWLAVVVITAATVALFTGQMGDSQWVAAVSLALGTYGAANVAEKNVK